MLIWMTHLHCNSYASKLIEFRRYIYIYNQGCSLHSTSPKFNMQICIITNHINRTRILWTILLFVKIKKILEISTDKLNIHTAHRNLFPLLCYTIMHSHNYYFTTFVVCPLHHKLCLYFVFLLGCSHPTLRHCCRGHEKNTKKHRRSLPKLM